MDAQPVETTLYSLSDDAPSDGTDRRDGDRHMTLYRVGSIIVDGCRELCLIKNISAGGMMIRLYCSITEGAPVTIELKSGHPVEGRVGWARDHHAGITFDEPVDVIDILSASMEGPRPRMPRIETNCHATLREGSNVLRVKTCDISQGGVKVQCDESFVTGSDLIISLPGLAPQAGIACWSIDGFTGITFNKLIPLGELVAWLHGQRNWQRSAR
ncbi:MAG TPA: PilZ domain-containing protein [Sphingomicrobium sp.]|nr:PilZ domain-containing protein [Sphingomicrobium sp.]